MNFTFYRRFIQKSRPLITTAQFLVFASLAIAFLFNQSLFEIFLNQDTKPNLDGILFILSNGLITATLILLCTLPFLLVNAHKQAIFIFVVIASVSNYFNREFGVVYDKTIIASLFQTTYSESTQYLNWGVMLQICLSFLSATAISFFFPVTKQNFHQRLLIGVKMMGLAALVFALSGLFFYKDYASFLRNNRQVRHLLLPVSPIYEVGRYWKLRLLPKPHAFTPIGLGAQQIKSGSKRKKLVVMVLGETARSDHFSLNGYTQNDTNPRLREKPVLTLPNVSSCGTATATSVPCLFSDLRREGFDVDDVDSRGNLLDVIQKAGFKVSWIDNNTGCQGVCERIKNIDLTPFKTETLCQNGTCFDEILINALRASITSTEDQFVVLHMIGSHGPSYHLRYPDRFKRFLPSCDTSDLGKCRRDEVINTYDNTILYTDYVLSEIITLLENFTEKNEVSFIYVSDHGESLGENGIYLHSLPYIIAPKEQKTVPLVFWFGDEQKTKKHKSLSSANSCAFSHDYIFSSLLGILDIKTSEYKKNLDFFQIDTQFCQVAKR